MSTLAGDSNSQLHELGLRAEQIPRHLAVIMDGNGRWAEAQGYPRIEGHRRGVGSVREIVENCVSLGVQYLTLYCFSSENWKRPEEELNLLMALLQQYVVEERPEIMRQNIRFTTIGRQAGMATDVLQEVQTTIDQSSKNTGMTLCLALNYGGRIEMVDAVRAISAKVQAGELSPEEIDESTISSHLYTKEMPDPDLMIRTSGEMRISNFLLWQLSYAELWITPRHWPEFRQQDLYQALRDFAARDRRFGGLKG